MMIDHGLDKLIRHRTAELEVNQCKFKQVMLLKAPIEALLLIHPIIYCCCLLL